MNCNPADQSVNRDLDPFKSGINTLGKYTSLNQMLKNGYYYIPGDVAANYAGHLIVAGYEDGGGTIRKTQYLIQDAGFKWRTVAGTLTAPIFGEWCSGVTTSDLSGRLSMTAGTTALQTPYNGNIAYRLQVDYNGVVGIYKTINKGGSWSIVKSL